MCRVAKFLETRGLTEKALQVAQDADYRFELALQLDNVDVAVEIAEELGSETRWKQLGELALADGKLALAERCLNASNDLSGMLLMHSATGNREGMQACTTSVAAPIFENSMLYICCCQARRRANMALQLRVCTRQLQLTYRVGVKRVCLITRHAVFLKVGALLLCAEASGVGKGVRQDQRGVRRRVSAARRRRLHRHSSQGRQAARSRVSSRARTAHPASQSSCSSGKTA